jgi:hypothetical protein
MLRLLSEATASHRESKDQLTDVQADDFNIFRAPSPLGFEIHTPPFSPVVQNAKDVPFGLSTGLNPIGEMTSVLSPETWA